MPLDMFSAEEESRAGVLTSELLIQSAATCNTQCAYELLEIDGAVFILIEDIENIVGELARVPEREELLVYSAEFRLV